MLYSSVFILVFSLISLLSLLTPAFNFTPSVFTPFYIAGAQHSRPEI